MRSSLKTTIFLLASLSCSLSAPCVQLCSAQEVAAAKELAQDKGLTVDRIFASGEFSARGFGKSWSSDSDTFVGWKKREEKSDISDWVISSIDESQAEVLWPGDHLTPAGSEKPIQLESGVLSADRRFFLIFSDSQRVWRDHTIGNYWLGDRTDFSLRKVGSKFSDSSLMFAKLSPVGDGVAYVHNGNIYFEGLDAQEPRALTKSDKPEIINGTSDWVYEEELSVRDCFSFAPDGAKIAYWQFDLTGLELFTLVNNTDTLYPTAKKFAYPKVGTKNASVRGAIVSVETGETIWMDLPGDPAEHYLARMEWIDNSRLLVQQLNRLQNENKLFIVNAKTGKATELYKDSDPAWVEACDEISWNSDKTTFTFVSEKEGWRTAYLVDVGTGELSRISAPDHDVVELLHTDFDLGIIYYIASPTNPTERYLYRATLDGSTAERITPAEVTGWNDYQISPSGKYAIHTQSDLQTPPTIQLIELPEHKQVRLLEDNSELREKLRTLKPVDQKFFRVKLDDGTEIDGWMIAPKATEARSVPVIAHVYGEPWGTTVTNKWGGGGQLWHRMLAEQGFAVMSFDNRGTKIPRGREWRKCIYQQVGILAPKDQAEAMQKTLAMFEFLNEKRVGIWGWSGGGSMTLNAMFKFPDLYHVGIAIAPVPDQAYYDTIYQERYMRTPALNPQGFHDGSPINFAKQLQGKLLVIHGTGDDNCHYQTVEKLINELVKHDKQFSLMAYPNRSHGIYEGANTTRHLRKLMTQYFLENLK